MIGYGVLMPVLPFYTERMVVGEGISPDKIAMHVGLLTSVYPLSQLVTAFSLGKLSDRIGRKPLLILGLIGFIVMQFLTASAVTLRGLYLARIIGGILTSPIIPVGTAYISDMTTIKNRKKALAWSGTALGLGVVIGPAIGWALAENDLHFLYQTNHIRIDKFSVPFLFSAVLGIMILLLSIWKLKEPKAQLKENSDLEDMNHGLINTLRSFGGIFLISLILQFGLTTFEGSYSIFAKEKLLFNPLLIGFGYLICGLVMAIFQPIVAHRTKPGFLKHQIFFGMLISGISLFLLAFSGRIVSSYILIAFLALGFAIVTPNLLTAISSKNSRNSGQNLATLYSFNGLGQIAGPVYGTWIFTRGQQLPFATAGGFLILISGFLVLTSRMRKT